MIIKSTLQTLLSLESTEKEKTHLLIFPLSLTAVISELLVLGT